MRTHNPARANTGIRRVPGLGLGVFMRRRVTAPRRVAALAATSALLTVAGIALWWLA